MSEHDDSCQRSCGVTAMPAHGSKVAARQPPKACHAASLRPKEDAGWSRDHPGTPLTCGASLREAEVKRAPGASSRRAGASSRECVERGEQGREVRGRSSRKQSKTLLVQRSKNMLIMDMSSVWRTPPGSLRSTPNNRFPVSRFRSGAKPRFPVSGLG